MSGIGYNMMNDDNYANWCYCRGHCGSIRRLNRELRCRGSWKNTLYASLLDSEGGDSFRKPL